MNISEVQAVFDRATPTGIKGESKKLNVLAVVLGVAVIGALAYVFISQNKQYVKMNDSDLG